MNQTTSAANETRKAKIVARQQRKAKMQYDADQMKKAKKESK
jgi:hypothetical protein